MYEQQQQDKKREEEGRLHLQTETVVPQVYQMKAEGGGGGESGDLNWAEAAWEGEKCIVVASVETVSVVLSNLFCKIL